MSVTAKGKERQRYILIHYFVIPQHEEESSLSKRNEINEKMLWKSISKTHTALHGDLKAAQSGMYVMQHDSNLQLFTLRTSLESISEVLMTLTMTNQLQGMPCVMWPIKISGTMKTIKKQINLSKDRMNKVNQQLRIFFIKNEIQI